MKQIGRECIYCWKIKQSGYLYKDGAFICKECEVDGPLTRNQDEDICVNAFVTYGEMLRRLCPWHPNDLWYVKTFLSIKKINKFLTLSQFNRIKSFNRYLNERGYKTEQSKWANLLKIIKKELPEQFPESLPTFSWEQTATEANASWAEKWALKRRRKTLHT